MCRYSFLSRSHHREEKINHLQRNRLTPSYRDHSIGKRRRTAYTGIERLRIDNMLYDIKTYNLRFVLCLHTHSYVIECELDILSNSELVGLYIMKTCSYYIDGKGSSAQLTDGLQYCRSWSSLISALVRETSMV
jgi:hypothetical protein